MCLAPKMPKVEFKDPAPPPPAPEESAAYSQGTPEMVYGRSKKPLNFSNKLRIDKIDSQRNAKIPRLA